MLASRFMLTGDGYAWKIRNHGRRPVQLWPIPTSTVTITEATAGLDLIQGYHVDGNSGLVPPEDMLRIRDIAPGSALYSSCGMRAAWMHYQLDEERKQFIAEMMVNADVPGLLLKRDGRMTPEQLNALKAAITERSGRGNRGNSVVLPEAIADVIQNTPLSDFDWPGLTGLIETRICMAFGVPPILIGTRAGLDRSTYANYGEARKSFYVETMTPLWRLMSETMTADLLRREGESTLEIRFVWDHLPEFQEDEDGKALRAMRLYTSGLIGMEEARGIIGYDDAIPSDTRRWGSANTSRDVSNSDADQETD